MSKTQKQSQGNWYLQAENLKARQEDLEAQITFNNTLQALREKYGKSPLKDVAATLDDLTREVTENYALIEEIEQKRWYEIDKLAFEYTLIRDNDEENPKRSVYRRTPRQSEIVDELATRLQKYVTIIAEKMMGDGYVMTVNKTKRRLSLPNDSSRELEDNVQEGLIGVIRCLKTYDPTRGTFSTHAGINAASAMFKAGNEDVLIRIPDYMISQARPIVASSMGYKDALNKLMDGRIKIKNTKEPLPFHMAQAVLTALDPKYVCIDMPAGDAWDDSPSNDSWGDRYLADENSINQDEAQDLSELTQLTDSVLGTLTERERNVLELLLGLKSGDSYGNSQTLEEVGQEFYVTQERIHQIENKALRKLRHPTRAKKLVPFAR